MVQVYRRKWVIHIERITREKVNGEKIQCYFQRVLCAWSDHVETALSFAYLVQQFFQLDELQGG